MFANCMNSMKKNARSFLLLIIIFQVIVQALSSCANIIPPSGGPKDTLPPVLIKADPPDSSLQFNANRVTLTFNEYVQVDPQLMQSIITSPNPVQSPYVESHLTQVSIRIKDTLQPNTTYSINFGNAIKDVDENNPIKNFTYVFSTGKSIANGTLSGRVLMAQTGVPDSTLIVILHKDLNDSAIKKERPLYYTSLDSAGRFHFKYLAYGKYNVFVLPNDYTKKYDDSTKAFAFLNNPVIIDSNESAPLSMYAFNQYKPSKEGATNTSNSQPPPKRKSNDTTKAINFSTNLQKGEQDLLSSLVISFQKSLQHFDSSKIILSDTNFKAINNYVIKADTSFKNFSIIYPWKENEYFKLIVEKDAFVDSTGKTIAKNDTLKFKTSSESSYGSIRLRFANLDLNKNPVLQFIQNNEVVDSFALTTPEFYRQLFKPGDYSIKILYDSDKNLTWTPGNYELKKQPEIVIDIPKKLNIKQNWDNEINIGL